MSGLVHLARCTYRFVNKIVVSSFVERWQPETDTFHFTVGEMTITLDDVATILGLLIVGKSISVRKLSERRAIALVVNTLEIDEQEVRHEIIACAGRAYLLFLLGCTLFSDKTGTRVLVVYLSLLSDVKEIADYMTLLEGWIYEHFRGFQPHLNMNYTRDMPHVYRWTSRRESGEERQLQAFREELDRVFGTHTRVAEMSIRVTQLCSITTIPNPPLGPMRASRGATAPRYNVMYAYLDIIWEAWNNHVLSDRRRSTPIRLVLIIFHNLMWFTQIVLVFLLNITASQNAPPATAPDSQGDNGGGSSNYEDLRGYALWAISYGIASAIALRTIDALTSSRSTGEHEIAQQKKEKEKTSSGNSNPPPSICHIVFPSVTLINPTTTTSPDPKEETAAASASPNPKPAAAAGNVSTTTTTTDTSKGAKETAASASPKPPAAGEKETVGAAINRTIGSFFSQLQVENHPPPPQANKEDHDRALAKAQAITTNTCKHVIDFYNDCLGGGSWNKCDSYVDIMKKCHQMGTSISILCLSFYCTT
ncbi:hypothetical protein CsSME_00006279 [Camellia sinensis var. sinensis]